MKFFLLALFVVAATAAPLDDDSGPVDVIVNGVADGEALEIGDIVDIKMHEHVNGELAATSNLLHPYTAVGIAEAAAVAAAAAEEYPFNTLESADASEVIIPEPVVLPEAVAPEVANPEVVIPAPVVLPEPAAPEVVIPAPVVLPEPAAPEVVIPAPVVLPAPVAPEVVIPEPVVLPFPEAPEVVLEPAVVDSLPVASPQIPNGEIYNDGLVQVTLNTPQEVSVFSYLQSWFSMVINYFSDGVQTTQQIV